MTIPKSNHGVAVTGAENQSSGGDEPAKANYDQIADYLTDGYWEGDGGSRRAFDVAPGGTLTADITALTAEGQQLARWALESWTNVSGINFRFVESNADITFDDEESNAFIRPDISGNQIISSFVNVPKDFIAIFDSTIDSRSFFNYIHEIGHALGLGHAGPYDSPFTYRVDSIFPGDSWQATVMSSFSQTENTYIDASFAYPITPMIADIIAIQNLYGVPTDINAGDTIYGSQSNLDGYLGQVFALWSGEGNNPEVYSGENITLTLYDTGGRDTLNLRADTADQRIDLRPEGISDVYGLVGNLLIARDTWIEDAIAGSGNDKVIGNAVANRLVGGAGNDELWGNSGDDVLEGGLDNDVLEGGAGADRLLGGAGTDTVSYSESDGAVTVDLEAGTGEGGHAEGDVIVDVENVLGSGYEDVLGGNSGANRLSGGDGDDMLDGGAGADRLFGGAGVDTVSYAGSDRGVIVYLSDSTVKRGDAQGDVIVNFENVLGSVHRDVLGGDDGANRLSGGDGNDRLLGGAGDDMLEGGAGADQLFGGAGADTVSYAGSDRGVIVYLSEGTVKRGDAEGDVIVNFENVLGSVHGDVLGGDDGANRLFGGGGNDRLLGAGGDDVLEGGAGADQLFGGAGVDTVSYAGSARGVIVYLSEGTGKRGHAEGDVIVNFENVLGSVHGDVLGGDDGANRLSGGDGNDRLLGAGGDDMLEGGAGADQLFGGAGVDTVSYAGSDEAVTVDLEAGMREGGHAEGDTIVQVENVLGSGYGDVLGGDDGANRLSGGGGNDRLSGRGGDDMLEGDAGADRLEGGAGADRLFGGAGVDTISYNGSNEAVTVDLEAGTGKRGHAEGDVITDIENVIGSEYGDVLEGDGNANRLSGGSGDDRLSGRGGDDVLAGRAGADRLSGGAGVDTVSYAGSDLGVWVDLGKSTGQWGHAEGDVITDIENVIGSEYDDLLIGDDGANRLEGGAGADELRGDAGNDELWGGAGADELRGGAGNDELWGGAGADKLRGGAGIDWVSYKGSDRGVTVDLGEGTGEGGHAEGDVITDIENVFGSEYGDFLVGDDSANHLSGNDGYDRLSGGSGDDLLQGGAGDDFLWGGDGNDSLWGGGGNDYLDGRAGNDSLQGGAGDDWLWAGAGDDQLWGGAGDDLLEGGAGDDQLWGGAGNDSLQSDDGNDSLQGDDGNDDLSGGAGDDRLSGGAGDDKLWGDAGNDRLSGGVGDDTFGFYFGDGDDIITDFTDGDDLIYLHEAFDLSGFDELVISSDPDGVTIDLTAHGGGTIRLEGFDIADLDAGDFLFA